MNKTIFPVGSAILAALVCGGCASTTMTEFDPANTTSATRVHSMTTVSQSDCFIAARAAAQDAMTSPSYTNFLEQFKKENGGRIPLMQVSDYLRNDTNDPDLNMRLITDELTKALRDSGKVRITLATGRDAKGTFADARDLRHDKNFRQSTVAKQGTLNAPTLSLEGSIITNIVREGSISVKVTTFNLKIADITSGEEVWSYNKPIGVRQTRSTFGL